MTDLETALRTMLRERAQDITAVPGRVTELHTPRTAKNRSAWLVAASVAAVLAVVAAVIAVRDNGPSHRPVPPVTHPTPPPPPTLRPLRCTVPLPTAWQHSLARGTVSVAGQKLVPIGVTDDGDVLADESARVALPLSHKLVLVTPTGTVRALYDTPPPSEWGGMRIGDVSTEGNWVAFAVLVQAQSGGQGPVQVELVNTRTGAQRTLRPTSPNDATIVLGPVLAGGSVYWTEIDAGLGVATGRVRRYEIATRRTSVAGSGAVGGPVALAGGVYWTRDNVVITGHAGRRAPAGFDPTGAVTKGAPLLADGDTFAWIDTATMSSIKVSRNAAAPVTVVPAGRGGRPTGLTGDLLWWGGSVLDLRTGAAAEVGQPDVARGHTAAVQLADGRLSVLHTAALPGLHC